MAFFITHDSKRAQMTTTVLNGINHSLKWQRLFEMAATVYERENCGGKEKNKNDRKKESDWFNTPYFMVAAILNSQNAVHYP